MLISEKPVTVIFPLEMAMVRFGPTQVNTQFVPNKLRLSVLLHCLFKFKGIGCNILNKNPILFFYVYPLSLF